MSANDFSIGSWQQKPAVGTEFGGNYFISSNQVEHEEPKKRIFGEAANITPTQMSTSIFCC